MKYYLNGVSFDTYGVKVKTSQGMLDALELKTPLSLDWDGYHGMEVDLSAPRYGVRTITLECFSLAVDKSTSVQKLTEFFHELSKPGTHRLMIDTGESKPLVYEVYRQGSVKTERVWQGGVNVGVFTLELIEPNPIKKVYKHVRTTTANKTATLTITSEKEVAVFWGDGAKTEARGTDILLSHDYAKNGTYYIVIAGVIEEIGAITTNATLVWNLL